MQVYNNKSISNVLISIYREEGWKSFYRGLAAPLCALVVLNSMNFTLYAQFRHLLDSSYTSGDTVVDGFDGRVLVAGCLIGPFAGVVSTPFEFLKIQMQFNRIQCDLDAAASQVKATNAAGSGTTTGSTVSGTVRYRNTFHACRTIVTNYGYRPLYTGHTVNTLREMVFLTTYFGLYEHTKMLIVSALTLPTSISIPIAGGISGAIGWLISYPLDCVKGNIQNINLKEIAQNTQKHVRNPTQLINVSTGSNASSGIISTARNIINKNGFFGLYSGVSVSLLRAFIISATRFSCYESVMWALNDT